MRITLNSSVSDLVAPIASGTNSRIGRVSGVTKSVIIADVVSHREAASGVGGCDTDEMKIVITIETETEVLDDEGLFSKLHLVQSWISVAKAIDGRSYSSWGDGCQVIEVELTAKCPAVVSGGVAGDEELTVGEDEVDDALDEVRTHAQVSANGSDQTIAASSFNLNRSSNFEGGGVELQVAQVLSHPGRGIVWVRINQTGRCSWLMDWVSACFTCVEQLITTGLIKESP